MADAHAPHNRAAQALSDAVADGKSDRLVRDALDELRGLVVAALDELREQHAAALDELREQLAAATVEAPPAPKGK